MNAAIGGPGNGKLEAYPLTGTGRQGARDEDPLVVRNQSEGLTGLNAARNLNLESLNNWLGRLAGAVRRPLRRIYSNIRSGPSVFGASNEQLLAVHADPELVARPRSRRYRYHVRLPARAGL